MLSVRFWGVRGSIPCPGPDTVIYGGNTSCLEIRADEKLVVVDFGTGVRSLGEWIMANDFKKNKKIDADIFVTHTHWDHILGFPMFSPLYVSGAKLRVTGPVSVENDSLESIIVNQMSYKYWPVRAGELSAQIEYKQIRETEIDLGDGLCVKSKFLNHPVLCLGYRFEYHGKSIVLVFDHEPFYNLFPTNPADANYDEQAAKEGEAAANEENEKIKQFVKNADILVHDAQYTDEEYSKHIGWGHASFNHAVKTAADGGVKKLVFYHHEPAHTDAQLKEIEKKYRKNKTGIEILMSKEGMVVQA
jgi:phosphoribosyl 1,2-cyclic phosphodiesterase